MEGAVPLVYPNPLAARPWRRFPQPEPLEAEGQHSVRRRKVYSISRFLNGCPRSERMVAAALLLDLRQRSTRFVNFLHPPPEGEGLHFAHRRGSIPTAPP